jgi:hypothetical protein
MDLKDIFGEPNKGLHLYRIYNIAIVDVVLTIIAAYFIAEHYKMSFIKTLVLLFVLGCVLHYVFGVQTTVNKWFTSEEPKIIHELNQFEDTHHTELV